METFPLDPEKTYYSQDFLTLDCENGPQTLKIGEWLNVDPVRIHRMVVKEKALKVDQMEVFAPRVSKLRRADYEYYKRIKPAVEEGLYSSVNVQYKGQIICRK